MIKTEKGTIWKRCHIIGDEISILLQFNSAKTGRNNAKCALLCTFCARIKTFAKMGKMKT